eukprot:TRINITY_DN6025_c0_g1_i2.p1 TRINITY_DN6025_c0_g1~~TRINITY_DN6025_c0_g1_i2.p1  ORF type:complete len:129 (-),score=20.43 TRINITY_DN6025_c0_g1_i2:13-399(-)
MHELLEYLTQKRGKAAQAISEDDIERAIARIKILGGFAVVRVGSTKLVQSVPCELSTDHTALLLFARDRGFFRASEVTAELKWTGPRLQGALGLLMNEGMVWIDDQDGERCYWVPSLTAALRTTTEAP